MEPSSHCPYLGLKQNRAIRFASPTPEHRCYVSGEAIEIPVDQANYCLSQGHIHCPLYTGSMLPTMEPSSAETAALDEPTGLRGWLATLSPRDRAIYTLMVGTLGLIAGIYLFLGLQSLFVDRTAVRPTPAATSVAVGIATAQATAQATSAPTTEPPTPTALPTSQPTPEPTLEPTAANVLFPPTQVATAVAPSMTPATLATEQATVPAATVAVATTTPAAPAQTTVAPATALPTSAPVVVPTTAPTVAPTHDPTVAPTQPVINTTREIVTLYFGDTTGSLFVPVQRQAQVENGQIAAAALRELIAGPQSGLTPLLLPTTQILDLKINDGTAIVNFDRRPTGQGDVRGYYAVVYTLTQFPNIRQVQFQINGQNTGVGGTGPVVRPVLNVLNPQGLPESIGASEFLPLYFPLNDGMHDVRIIRVVPKTSETIQATINALLEGPGNYGYAVQRVIPEGTQLRGIKLDTGARIVWVDFSQEFTNAVNREAAVRNIVQSLTTLPNIRGVRLLVEGQPLADFWGEEYRNGFGKPLINPE